MQRSPSGQERRSSLVTVTKVDETPEQLLDQNAGFNANADWVNYKGTLSASYAPSELVSDSVWIGSQVHGSSM